MARAVLVCSICGKELSATDKFCPECGVKVEPEGSKPESEAQSTARVLTCEVCGHENSHSGTYCETCGAQLPARNITHAPLADEAEKPGPLRRRVKPSSSSSFNPEPWHYVVGILIAGIVGVFVYMESQRESSANVGQPASAPAQSTAAQTPPSKELLDAIDRLQRTVNENPNDAGSKLLLANTLHDGAMHDAMMLPRAIEAYKSYLKDKPGDPNARVDLGICYFELGKIDSVHSVRLYSMAIDEIQTAVRSSPTHQPAAFNLAIVYLYSGDFDESNRWFRKAVDLNPESELGKRAKVILEQHNPAG